MRPRFGTEPGEGMGARLVYFDCRGERHVLEQNLGYDLAGAIVATNQKLIDQYTERAARVFPDPWNEAAASSRS